MNRYARIALSASRLINEGARKSNLEVVYTEVGYIAESSLNPCDFHCIPKPMKPCWPLACHVQEWTHQLANKVRNMLLKFRPEISELQMPGLGLGLGLGVRVRV